MNADEIGLISAVFVVVGAGVGLVAAVTTGWAEAALATAATGETARFGPVFVAQTYLAVTTVALMLTPLLAGILGILVGSRAYDAKEFSSSSSSSHRRATLPHRRMELLTPAALSLRQDSFPVSSAR